MELGVALEGFGKKEKKEKKLMDRDNSTVTARGMGDGRGGGRCWGINGDRRILVGGGGHTIQCTEDLSLIHI